MLRSKALRHQLPAPEQEQAPPRTWPSQTDQAKPDRRRRPLSTGRPGVRDRAFRFLCTALRSARLLHEPARSGRLPGSLPLERRVKKTRIPAAVYTALGE
jgi:hypothetical protein